MPRRHHDDDAGVLIRTSSAFRTLAAVVALPVVAGACIPADALTPHVTSTLDAALAEVAHPALDYASAAFSGAGLVAQPIVPSRCPLDSTTSSFVCAPLSGRGLTLNQRFTLLDSAGARQTAFDGNTTKSVSVTSIVGGTTINGTLTITVDGKQTLDLVGLGSLRHKLNGTSVTEATIADAAGGTSATTTIQTTIVDLVIPVLEPDKPPPWPLSGMIDIRSFTNHDLTGSLAIAELTFHGSSIVTLTQTVTGGIVTCQLGIVASPLDCAYATPGRPAGGA